MELIRQIDIIKLVLQEVLSYQNLFNMYYQNSLYYVFIRIMANFRKLTEFVKNLNNQFLRISQNII